jgi:hypothetical protein
MITSLVCLGLCTSQPMSIIKNMYGTFSTLHMCILCLLPWTIVLQHPVFSSRPIHTQAMTRKLLRPPTSCIYNTLVSWSLRFDGLATSTDIMNWTYTTLWYTICSCFQFLYSTFKWVTNKESWCAIHMEEQKIGSLDLKINMKSHGNVFFFLNGHFLEWK